MSAHLWLRGLVAGALCAAVAVSPAAAWIDAPSSDDAPAPPPSVLRLKGKTVQENPSVIHEEQRLFLPPPFPGGCFNCSTLGSNHGNLSRSLMRSHDFSQDFYSGSGQKFIFLDR